MKKRSKFDLQKKTMVLASFSIMFWLLASFVVYFEIRNLENATLNLETIEDIYDFILEMRRYEKNYLLYQGKENKELVIEYYRKTQEIYQQLNSAPEKFKTIMDDVERLGENLEEYGHAIDFLKRGNLDAIKKVQEDTRQFGGRLIDLSKRLLIDSRQTVAKKAKIAIRIALSTTGLAIVLFICGWYIIVQKVVKPLVLLEKATEKIGRGDFGPLHHPGRIESYVDRLIFAFNRMVEELDARQEQIIHTRKIASLGTLVSGVAHELNNPINNIILTVDSLVGKQKITDERRAKLLEDILEQAIRAGGIVKNLLDFSRAEVSAMQDVDITSILNNIFKITENELTLKKVILHKELSQDLPLIVGNRQGLQQVFFNLVTNAIQAMQENGHLTVTAALDERRWVQVTVQDSGEGISEDDLPHIFDPFFTTKDVGKGTGLGLSVSYGIIKKHGGRITVSSIKNRGTKFYVTLPAKEELDDV